jgi:hypothetical protein
VQGRVLRWWTERDQPGSNGNQGRARPPCQPAMETKERMVKGKEETMAKPAAEPMVGDSYPRKRFPKVFGKGLTRRDGHAMPPGS